MKIDDWFKPLLLAFIIIFLFIFYLHSQNGRYTLIHFGDSVSVLDSRTGMAFAIGNGNAVKLDLPSGKMTTAPVQKN